MKLAQHKNSLLSNAQIETNNFSIGDASIIIDILRNRLYEHKVRTLVQEYLCNARDAHREVNQTKPFEVTLPNQGNLMFKVRDFGPGISVDRIANVFVKYGNSTKRGDNGQTGGFGIGAKSAWAYTDSFNVITYIDKIKRVYIAHTGTNNTGSLDLISTSICSEENGTEISFAVKSNDINEFTQSVYRCVYFWEQKPIFKGTLETPNFDHFNLHGFKLIRQNDIFRDRRYVLVDSVPYELPSELRYETETKSLLDQLRNDYAAFIPVKTGDVEVSASRESIVNTPKNFEFLKGVLTFYFGVVKNYVNQQTKQTTILDTIQSFKLLHNTGFCTQGLKVKFTEYVIESSEVIHREKEIFKSSNARYSNRRWMYKCPLYYLDKPLNNAQIKRRIATLGKTHFFWLEDPKLVSELGALPFSAIAETMPTPSVGSKVKETITVRNLNRYGKQEKDIASFDKSKDVFLTEDQWPSYANIEKFVSDITFYVIAKSNIKKVQATGCLTIDVWYKTFIPDESQLIDIKKSILSNFKIMESLSLTNDNFLNEMIGIYEKYKLTYDQWGDSEKLSECRIFRTIPEIAELITLDEKLTQLIDTKYPLLKSVDLTLKKELIVYINAKNS